MRTVCICGGRVRSGKYFSSVLTCSAVSYAICITKHLTAITKVVLSTASINSYCQCGYSNVSSNSVHFSNYKESARKEDSTDIGFNEDFINEWIGEWRIKVGSSCVLIHTVRDSDIYLECLL